ncbi:MAG: hypothetical protein GX663_08835 [Clostridiales bacterium]|nr:hypothetical protein [Clostridiales bacterium]
MLKILGCLMMFSGCTALGFIKAETYKLRRVELGNTLESIRLLQIDMTYKKETLQRAFKHLQDVKPCWFSKLLIACSHNLSKSGSVTEAWQMSLKNSSDSPLKKEDIVILNDIFTGLGKSDITGQESIFKPAIFRLEAAYDDALAEEKKQGRMFKCLGSFAGLAIVILLI